jgi:hypothetical protein
LDDDDDDDDCWAEDAEEIPVVCTSLQESKPTAISTATGPITRRCQRTIGLTGLTSLHEVFSRTERQL